MKTHKKFQQLVHLSMFGLIILTSIICSGYGPSSGPAKYLYDGRLNTGMWRAELQVGKEVLPFTFKLMQEEGEYSMIIYNASEELPVENLKIEGDSFTISMPHFDSEFEAIIISDEHIKGRWFNYAKGNDYAIPFTAKAGNLQRFEVVNQPQWNVTGKWKVTFSPNGENATPAIGEFQQVGAKVTGTFITETGDYRFLEGVVSGNELQLSCFDGAHAFLFNASIKDDSMVNGIFFSGNHWQESWIAERNDSFTLRDPDELTYLKSGYDGIDFSFPNLQGKMVTLDDEQFQNKVIIIQIMGSWCPNCMDETRLYKELYEEWNADGLEILALAFENTDQFEKAVKNIMKFKQDTGAGYEFLIAGKADKQAASEALPMLNHIMSYPTSIFIDRSGKIRKIHTGFYGPGTGDHYTEYRASVRKMIQDMLMLKLPEK